MANLFAIPLAKGQTDQLAIQGSLHPLIELEPSLGISALVARGVIRGWASRQQEYWQSLRGQRQAKSFLKGPSALKKKLGIYSTSAETS